MRSLAFTILGALSATNSQASKKTAVDEPIIRWTAGSPGSTSLRTPDGKYVYSLRNGDLVLSITVDSQELEKARHRPLPVFAIRLDAHYSGSTSCRLPNDHIVLEFLNHFQVVAGALDPDELATRIQADMDNLSDEVEHEIRRHPETKLQQESLLQSHLKDLTDLVGFVSLRGLRSTTLDAGNPSVAGWFFFDTRNKWIGKWKAQEAFILRIPAASTTYEFPFQLPPKKGEKILRQRLQ